MHINCLIILLFATAHIKGQDPIGLITFIPKGFQILDSLSGDLNGDKDKDVILILKKADELRIPESVRPLMLLMGSENGFNMLTSNDSVVLCKSCGGVFGDPYERIIVEKGSFSIEHYGGSSWRWTRTITFKYDADLNKFLLENDSGLSYHTSEPDSTKTIVHNEEYFNKMSFEDYSVYRE